LKSLEIFILVRPLLVPATDANRQSTDTTQSRDHNDFRQFILPLKHRVCPFPDGSSKPSLGAPQSEWLGTHAEDEVPCRFSLSERFEIQNAAFRPTFQAKPRFPGNSSAAHPR
jgi:hypothetical protein